MKRLRFIIGLFFIIIAIGGLLLWEIKGRETILMEEVVVAKADIIPGERLEPHLLTTIRIPKDNMIEAPFTSDDLGKLRGKIAHQHILKNSQISSRFLSNKRFSLGKNQSVYSLKSDWIFMRSSSLRRGDEIEIINRSGGVSLGTYRVAFVKDIAEREVKDLGEAGSLIKEEGTLGRLDSTSQIDHIEIIATMNQYNEILNNVLNEGAPSLIIVQRGEGFDQ